MLTHSSVSTLSIALLAFTRWSVSSISARNGIVLVKNQYHKAMEFQSELISVELSDGTVIKVEATPIGEQEVGGIEKLPFKEATRAIKSIVEDIAETLQTVKEDVKPDKVAIKLGLEIALETGQLTALIVKGASKANLEITIEWGK